MDTKFASQSVFIMCIIKHACGHVEGNENKEN